MNCSGSPRGAPSSRQCWSRCSVWRAFSGETPDWMASSCSTRGSGTRPSRPLPCSERSTGSTRAQGPSMPGPRCRSTWSSRSRTASSSRSCCSASSGTDGGSTCCRSRGHGGRVREPLHCVAGLDLRRRPDVLDENGGGLHAAEERADPGDVGGGGRRRDSMAVGGSTTRVTALAAIEHGQSSLSNAQPDPELTARTRALRPRALRKSPPISVRPRTSLSSPLGLPRTPPLGRSLDAWRASSRRRLGNRLRESPTPSRRRALVPTLPFEPLGLRILRDETRSRVSS